MADWQLPENPISYKQYDEYIQMLNDDETLNSMELGKMWQIQAEMQQFNQAREVQRQRLRAQGLDDEQIARVEGTLRDSAYDPNGKSLDDTVRQNPGRDFIGAMEGGVQAIEGVADLAMDLSVTLGLDSEEDRQAWKDDVAEARTLRRVAQADALGQLPGPISEVVGQVIPWVMAGGSAVRTTDSIVGNTIRFLTRQAQLGGIAAAAQMQGDDQELIDRGLDAMYGTAFGTLFAVPFAVGPVIRARASQNLVRAFNEADPEQRELVELLVQEMTGNPNFKFSASQLTGARFYQNLELATADRATKSQQNINLDSLYNNLMKLIKQQGAQGKTANQIVSSFRETLKKVRSDLYADAQKRWGVEAKRIVQTYGDDAVIDGREYLAKIDTLIADENNILKNMGAMPSENLLRYRNRVERLVNPNKAKMYQDEKGTWRVVIEDTRNGTELRVLGDTSTEEGRALVLKEAEARATQLNNEWGGPNAEETLDLLAGLNDMIGGKTAIFENASASSNRTQGRALMGNFTAAMRENPANPDVVADIERLRQAYRMDMAAAQAIDESVFGTIFGRAKRPKNAGKALDQALAGEEEDLIHMREFLEEYNPELLYEMRATHLQRVVNKSTNPTKPDVDTGVDLNKLANNLSDTFGRQGRAGMGLHNRGTQEEMMLTAEALRILNNKQFRGIVPGGTRPEEWSINLISRSPEFFGRFVTRLFASGQTLERALLDPQWRHSLRTIAKEDLTSKTGKAALLYLANWYRSREEERNFTEQQARQEKAAQDEAARLLQQGGPM